MKIGFLSGLAAAMFLYGVAGGWIACDDTMMHQSWSAHPADHPFLVCCCLAVVLGGTIVGSLSEKP